MLDVRNKDRYDRLVRFCSMASAVMMLWISAMFSAAGFSFDQPGKQWIGYALAAIIIVVEIVWNKKGAKHGVTLYVGGLACYVYGLWTNVLGILISSGANPVGVGFAFMASFGALALSNPVALFGGILLELLPEPLLIWALTGDSTESDPLGHVMDFQQGVESKTETAQEKYHRIRKQTPPGYSPNNYRRPVQSSSQPAYYPRSAPKPRAVQQTFSTEPTYHPLRNLNEEDDEGR